MENNLKVQNYNSPTSSVVVAYGAVLTFDVWKEGENTGEAFLKTYLTSLEVAKSCLSIGTKMAEKLVD